MPSKDNLYNGRKGIGFENPSYFEKAKDLRQMLYDEKVIGLGYTLMFLTHSNEALEIKKFKRSRENKIKFAYDYENLNASYVNEKINFKDDYFQEIINPYFEKIDSPFQQTSSLKPYVPNVILEKNIIDLEDEVVNILKKEKVNLETIEFLKSKGFESSETAISESENQSENIVLWLKMNVTKRRIQSNETTKDLWDALERQMRGSEYDEQDRKATILSVLTRKTTQNQGDVNDALVYKKKAVVVHSDPLALVAEKTNSANKKQEFVKTDDKKVEKKADEKKRDMNKVKCYNCKKEGHFAKDCKKAKVKDYNYYKTNMLLAKKDSDEQVLLAEDQAWMESSSDFDKEINANMVFMAQIEKVLSESDESSSAEENNTENFFHDAIEFASENFIENHIDSQKDYDKSEADHNDSEEKEHSIDKLIRKFNYKIAKCQKRVEKANQQSKDFENQNKDLQEKYDVLINQVNTFEEKNNEFNDQIKVLNEKNDDLLDQTRVLKDQLQVKYVVIDT
nr:hypothetical protein [Tanacetum cinerariifolium]